MEDERLADLLEELPEEEQIRIIEGLDLERAAHVLEEMEPDDAADLLGEMAEGDRQRLLAAMEPEESRPLRQLLTYDDDTAGGLMTPEPVILPFTATVAEALAVIREADLPVELAAQVFVVQPPTSTPTGRYLGLVPFQRLLREPPGTTLEHCVFAEPDAVAPELPAPRRGRAARRLRRPGRARVRPDPAARRRGHRRRRPRPRAARTTGAGPARR